MIIPTRAVTLRITGAEHARRCDELAAKIGDVGAECCGCVHPTLVFTPLHVTEWFSYLAGETDVAP
jgi:hypothetical protein